MESFKRVPENPKSYDQNAHITKDGDLKDIYKLNCWPIIFRTLQDKTADAKINSLSFTLIAFWVKYHK